MFYVPLSYNMHSWILKFLIKSWKSAVYLPRLRHYVFTTFHGFVICCRETIQSLRSKLLCNNILKYTVLLNPQRQAREGYSRVHFIFQSTLITTFLTRRKESPMTQSSRARRAGISIKRGWNKFRGYETSDPFWEARGSQKSNYPRDSMAVWRDRIA